MSSANANADFGLEPDAPDRLEAPGVRHDDPDEEQAPVEAEEEDEDAAESEEEEDESEEEEEEEDPLAITEEERTFALDIKEAIASAPDVDPVTDFMCVQLAIIDGDNTERAVERAYHLQCFREEYALLDIPEAGRRSFAAYLELVPRVHLSFFVVNGSYMMIFDNKAFKGSNIRTEEDVRTWLGGTYYTCTVLFPDFPAIRKGAILVMECQGYDWKQGIDFKSLKRMWSEIGMVYPCIVSKAKYFHSGTTMNLVFSLLKPFLPEQLKSRVEFGCRFPQRLDQVYLVPTPEQADLRFLQRIEETLRMRYENERTFRL